MKILPIIVVINKLTLLDDDQVKHAEMAVNDAATHRLPLALTAAGGAVAGLAFAEEQADATSGQHTLLHGEPLFVIATRDAQNVTLETK